MGTGCVDSPGRVPEPNARCMGQEFLQLLTAEAKRKAISYVDMLCKKKKKQPQRTRDIAQSVKYLHKVLGSRPSQYCIKQHSDAYL